MKRYRSRKRAGGFKQVQVWTADRQSPAFRRELRKQARRIAASESEREVLDFIESVSDWTEK